MTDSQRNFMILLAVAVAGVLFSDAFGIGAGIANLLINVAFTILIVSFAVILYRKHSGTIAGMPHVPRLVLQAAVMALVFAFATGMLHLPFLPFPFGWSSVYPVAFWALVLSCGFAIWWSWQQRSTRW